MPPRSVHFRRTLITGSSGALGRALAARVRQLAPDTPLVGLDRRRVELEGVVVEPVDLITAHFEDIVRPGDLVFHLAAFVHRNARSSAEVRELYEVNHHATARLAGACLERAATLVFASTVGVFADTEYGRSKALAENAIRDHGAKGLPFAIVRFPLLYGPYGAGNLERMLRAIGRRRYWPIGDPKTPKSCLFLEDAAQALVLAAEFGRASTWLAAPSPPPTLGDIHRAAYQAMGRRQPTHPIPRFSALAVARALQVGVRVFGQHTPLPDQIETLTAPTAFDGSAFAEATGFLPRVGLDEGMRRTAAWLVAAARTV